MSLLDYALFCIICILSPLSRKLFQDDPMKAAIEAEMRQDRVYG